MMSGSDCFQIRRASQPAGDESLFHSRAGTYLEAPGFLG
ncbi:MAG: hypothetical protein JWQ55_1506, partial [Rhodopila sp.]|nr:hypothetical protein [Rhodopila sp.]